MFSNIARPLLKLLKKHTSFSLDDDCVDSFKKLKNALAEAPVLAIYNPRRETKLHCDASAAGFGAVLLQRQEDQKMHPVSYFSKATSSAEAKYHSFELETLAIVYALRRFRPYFEGIPFHIVTDCHSLTLTLEKKHVNARIARWALELDNYNYKIVHRRGTSMKHVDALSRCVMSIEFDPVDVDFYIRMAQERDENIKNIREKLSVGKVKNFDGLVCRIKEDGTKLLCIPGELEDNIIRVAHEKVGHQSVDKTCNKISRLYWITNLRQKVTRFIGNCLKCVMYAAPCRQGRGPCIIYLKNHCRLIPYISTILVHCLLYALSESTY